MVDRWGPHYRCPYCKSPDIDSTEDGIHMYCKECGRKWNPYNKEEWS